MGGSRFSSRILKVHLAPTFMPLHTLEWFFFASNNVVDSAVDCAVDCAVDRAVDCAVDCAADCVADNAAYNALGKRASHNAGQGMRRKTIMGQALQVVRFTCCPVFNSWWCATVLR